MTTTPYMPMYWGDYLRDTGHLTTAQHGAYVLLLGHYWCLGSVPGELDEQMAAITRQPVADWQAMKAVIAPLFKRGWKHKRIEEDLAKLYAKQEKRRAAGHLGGIQSGAVRSGRTTPKHFVGIDARGLSEAFASRNPRSLHATSKIPPQVKRQLPPANASKQMLRSDDENAHFTNNHSDFNGSSNHEANASNRVKQMLPEKVKQMLPYQVSKKDRSNSVALENSPLPVDNVDNSETPGSLATAPHGGALARPAQSAVRGIPEKITSLEISEEEAFKEAQRVAVWGEIDTSLPNPFDSLKAWGSGLTRGRRKTNGG